MTPDRLAAEAAQCLDAAVETFRAHTDPMLERFANDIDVVDRSHVQRGPLPRYEHPTMAQLDTALETGLIDNALGRATSSAAHCFDWGQVYADAQIGTGVADGMFAAQMAGTYGVFASDGLAAGLFLLAPNLHYPIHTHEAEEVYYCLSGKLTLQHGLDGDPFEISGGEYSVTPSHRLHALTTVDEPALLLYVWRGNLHAPIWLWEAVGAGWERVQWVRLAGQPWKQMRREAVDEAILQQAIG